jgi:hypothetical protein
MSQNPLFNYSHFLISKLFNLDHVQCNANDLWISSPHTLTFDKHCTNIDQPDFITSLIYLQHNILPSTWIPRINYYLNNKWRSKSQHLAAARIHLLTTSGGLSPWPRMSTSWTQCTRIYITSSTVITVEQLAEKKNYPSRPTCFDYQANLLLLTPLHE